MARFMPQPDPAPAGLSAVCCATPTRAATRDAPPALAETADGQIDTMALLAAVWAAAQACFIRAGIANEAAKAQQ